MNDLIRMSGGGQEVSGGFRRFQEVAAGLGCYPPGDQVSTERLPGWWWSQRSLLHLEGAGHHGTATNTGVCCLNRIIIKYILTNCWIRTAMGEYSNRLAPEQHTL